MKRNLSLVVLITFFLSAALPAAESRGGRSGGRSGGFSGGRTSSRPSYSRTSSSRPSYSRPSSSRPSTGYRQPSTGNSGYRRTSPSSSTGRTTRTTPLRQSPGNTQSGRRQNTTPATSPNRQTHTTQPQTRTSHTGSHPNGNSQVGQSRTTSPRTGVANAPGSHGNYATTRTKDGYLENHGNHVVKYRQRSDGTYFKEYVKSGGHTKQFDANGRVTQDTRGGRVTTYHADGSHTVARNGVPQYTQRTVTHGGKTVIQRSYTRNNVTVVKNYNTYVRGGYTYHSYVPFMSYDPYFYGYLYSPWNDPFYYNWGWASAPWYGYYGYYYHPYPAYYGPSYWLTDYILADILANQYQNQIRQSQAPAVSSQVPTEEIATPERLTAARQHLVLAEAALTKAQYDRDHHQHWWNRKAKWEGRLVAARAERDSAQLAVDSAEQAARDEQNALNGSLQASVEPSHHPQVASTESTPITQAIKDQIKAQVEEAIHAHERKETVPLDTVLQDTKHLFALTDEIDATLGDLDHPVQNADGSTKTCSLTAGDLIRLTHSIDDKAVAANMVVITSKRGSCPAGSSIIVSTSDLQEFHNAFSERLEDGMQKMKTEIADKKK